MYEFGAFPMNYCYVIVFSSNIMKTSFHQIVGIKLFSIPCTLLILTVPKMYILNFLKFAVIEQMHTDYL